MMTEIDDCSSESSLFEDDPTQCEDVKIILLGAAGVGKTSFAQRFPTGEFDDLPVTTVGIDYQIKQIWVQHKDVLVPVNVTLYDTAGQERFSSMTRSYYQRADAAVIVFDVNNDESYSRAAYLRQEMAEHKPSALCVLVGNKTDELWARRKVKPNVAELDATARTALHFQLGFRDTSVKNDPDTGDKIAASVATAVVAERRAGRPASAQATPARYSSAMPTKMDTVELGSRLRDEPSKATKKPTRRSFCLV
jgi:small GTP-binding protein